MRDSLLNVGGGGLRSVEWLARPLVADGVVVAGPLDPARLTDADLRAICARMHSILDTVEMPRCEGRLLPVELFDAIDTLAGRVMHPGEHPPRLAEWVGVIREFGAYYGLAGGGPITVDLGFWRRAAAWLGVAPDAEPSAADVTLDVKARLGDDEGFA